MKFKVNIFKYKLLTIIAKSVIFRAKLKEVKSRVSFKHYI